MEHCYICGHEGLRWEGHFFYIGGPQDALNLRLFYFEEEQGICDICMALLQDVVFTSRHDELDGKTWTRLRKAWKANLKKREAEEK